MIKKQGKRCSIHAETLKAEIWSNTCGRGVKMWRHWPTWHSGPRWRRRTWHQNLPTWRHGTELPALKRVGLTWRRRRLSTTAAKPMATGRRITCIWIESLETHSNLVTCFRNTILTLTLPRSEGEWMNFLHLVGTYNKAAREKMFPEVL